jgi:hypothetical protein
MRTAIICLLVWIAVMQTWTAVEQTYVITQLQQAKADLKAELCAAFGSLGPTGCPPPLPSSLPGRIGR